MQSGSASMSIVVDDREITSAALLATLAPPMSHRVAARIGDQPYASVVAFASVTALDVQQRELPLAGTYDGPGVADSPLCTAGVPSQQLELQTLAAGLPGPNPAPSLVPGSATGGKLNVAMSSGDDTGGVPVASFALFLSAIDSVGLLAHLEVCWSEMVFAPEVVTQTWFSGRLRVEVESSVREHHAVHCRGCTDNPGCTAPRIICWKVPSALPRVIVLTLCYAVVSRYSATVEVSGLPSESVFVASVQLSTDAVQCAASDAEAPSALLSTLAATPPTAVRGFAIRAVPGAAYLSWTYPADRGGTFPLEYNLEVQAAQGEWQSVLSTLETKATLVGLSPQRVYTVRIYARTSAGRGVGATASFFSPGIARPSPPWNIAAADIQGGSLTIQWCPPQLDGGSNIAQYSAQYRADADVASAHRVITVAASAERHVHTIGDVACDLTVVLGGLRANTKYTIDMKARSVAGLESGAATVAITTSKPTGPDAPVALKQLRATGGSVTMSWEPPANLGGVALSKYSMDVRDAGGNLLAVADAAPGPPGAPVTGTVYALRNNAEYRVHVTGINELGTPGKSAETTARTSLLATPPSRCQNIVVVQRTGGALYLRWEPPTDLGGFSVYRYSVLFGTAGSTLREVNQLVRVPEVRINGLTPDTGYSVMISAVLAWVAGPYTPEFTTFTGPASLPGVPVITTVSVASSTSAVVSYLLTDTGGVATSAVSFEVTALREVDGLPVEGSAETLASTSLTGVVQGLVPGNLYRLAVAAVNYIGTSAKSTYVLHNHTQPDGRAKLRLLQVGPALLAVAWDAPVPIPGAVLVMYRVFVNKVLYSELHASSTKVLVSGLNKGTNYELELRAVYQAAQRRLQHEAHRQLEAETEASSTMHATTASGDGVEVVYSPATLSFIAMADASREIEIRLEEDDVGNVMELRFTLFDIECDWDAISVYQNNELKWQGGCTRQLEFELVLPVGSSFGPVKVVYTSDGSVHGSGVVVEVRTYTVFTPASEVHLGQPEACPGRSDACSGSSHGACMIDGTCVCTAGHTGEDCSGHVFCPGPLCVLTNNDAERHDLVVVAPWGDDTHDEARGGGWIGRPVATGGAVPKPFASLARALQVAADNATIVVLPGVYTGWCELVLEGPQNRYTITSARDAMPAHTVGETTIDCQGGGWFARLVGTQVALSGVTITRATKGALHIVGGHVQLANSVVVANTADGPETEFASGGGIVLTMEATLRVDGVRIANCSARDGGGGAYIGPGSTLVAVGSALTQISNNTSPSGGGVLCESCNITGNTDADTGLCIDSNVAQVGGNVFVGTAGMHTTSYLAYTTLQHGWAQHSGGGIFVDGGAVIVAEALRVVLNAAGGHAPSTGGGGVFLAAAAGLAAVADTVVRGNDAYHGGGLMVSEEAWAIGNNYQIAAAWLASHAADSSTRSLRVHGNVATHNGGGVYVFGASTISGVDIRANCAGCESSKLSIHGPNAGVYEAGGGGLFVRAAVCTVADIDVIENRALSSDTESKPWGGGFLLAQNGSVVASRVVVFANTVSHGGNGAGVAVLDASVWTPAHTDTVGAYVHRNVVSGGCGAGVALRGSARVFGLKVEANLINASDAALSTIGGAGVCLLEGNATLGASVVVSNNASLAVGGGVFVGQSSTLSLPGTRVDANLAAAGAGAFVDGNASLFGERTTFTGNMARGHTAVNAWLSLLSATLARDAIDPTVGVGGAMLCYGCSAIDGVYVENSTASIGAGVALLAAPSSVRTVLTNVVITTGAASMHGGCVAALEGVSVTMTAVECTGNTANRTGGGLWASRANVSFANSGTVQAQTTRFTANRAQLGGGIYLQDAQLSARAGLGRILVNGNTAGAGGGVYCEAAMGASCLIQGVDVHSNTAASGGGVYVQGHVCQGAGTPAAAAGSKASLFVNVRIANCTADQQGGGVFVSCSRTELHGTVISSCSTRHTEQDSNMGGGMFVKESRVTGAGLVVERCTSRQGGCVAVEDSSVVAGKTSLGGDVHLQSCHAGLGGGALIVLPPRQHVLIHPSLLRGLRITAATASVGAGIGIAQGAHVALHECTIADCVAIVGGGIHAAAESVVDASHTVVQNCSARSGGGLHVDGATAAAANMHFRANFATATGGAVVLTKSATLHLSFSLASSNVAGAGGGFMSSVDRSAATLDSSIIANSRTTAQGGSLLHALPSMLLILTLSALARPHCRRWRKLSGDRKYT